MITADRTSTFAEIEAQFQTGDVIIFEGDSPLDHMIQMAEHAPYNHVGMIYRDGTGLYFWDAPGGGPLFPDPFRNNQPHSGCRVAPFAALMDVYMKSETKAFYRQLEPALSADQLAALRIFIDAADGMPFPGSSFTLPDELNLGIGLAASFAFGNEERCTKAGSYFCAHLVADSYMHMGLLPISPFPANSYSPADFASSDAAKLPLRSGVTMGDVVQFSWPPAVQAPAAATLPGAGASIASSAAPTAP